MPSIKEFFIRVFLVNTSTIFNHFMEQYETNYTAATKRWVPWALAAHLKIKPIRTLSWNTMYQSHQFRMRRNWKKDPCTLYT